MKDNNPSVVSTTEIADSQPSEEKASPSSPVSSLPTQQWPTKPVPIQGDRKSAIIMALYDAFLIFIPLILILKTGLVIAAWKQERNHHGPTVDLVGGLTRFLIEFNGQMVTAFTIVFVTVISTLVRRYALWKAQKGAYISELEQLQGSISLPSTIKLIWSLRAFTTTSISLLAVWSFYYLGSQASKLEFKLVNSGKFYNQIAGVPGPNFPSAFDADSIYFQPTWDIQDTNAAMISAIGYTKGPLNKPGTDLSGNPIVPDIKTVLNSPRGAFSKSGLRGIFGWINVERQSELESANAYTSLVGNGLSLYLDSSNPTHNSTWNQVLGDYDFTTSYFDIGCDLPVSQRFEAFPTGTLPGSLVSLNMTSASANAPKDRHGNVLRTFEYWVRWTANEEMGVNTNGSAKTVCNITSISVDVKAHCAETGCFPLAIRYVNDSSAETATNYSTPFSNNDFATKFFNNFTLTRPSSDLDGSYSMLTTAFSFTGSGYDTPQMLSDMVSNTINPALKIYFNTYYTLAQQGLQVLPWMTYVRDTGTDGLYVGTKLHGAAYDPHYAIYWAWIGIDFASCIILLIAAIISCRLRLVTLAPDIFGYVSSLTRDNPHLKGAVPDNGTNLNGIERARMLKGVKVKIGDVSGDDTDVARVGLAMVHNESSATSSSVSHGNEVPVARVEPLRPGMAVV